MLSPEPITADRLARGVARQFARRAAGRLAAALEIAKLIKADVEPGEAENLFLELLSLTNEAADLAAQGVQLLKED